MAEFAESGDVAFDMQLVQEFLQRYFTIENEIKVLQQDKSALRDEFKGRGLDMKTMTAAIAIAKKRQLVPVSKETLDELISEVESKRYAQHIRKWGAWGECALHAPGITNRARLQKRALQASHIACFWSVPLVPADLLPLQSLQLGA